MEFVVYAAEEAVRLDVEPDATAEKGLKRWLVDLAKLFKLVSEKLLGFKADKAPDITAEQLVNFAYGAAKQNLRARQRGRDPG